MRLVQLRFMAMSYMARAWHARHAYLVLWCSNLQYFVAGTQALYNYASQFRCMFDVARAWRAWRAPVVLGVTTGAISKHAHASGTITLHGYVFMAMADVERAWHAKHACLVRLVCQRLIFRGKQNPYKISVYSHV